MRFEYKCSKCKEIIEVEKSIKEDHPTQCPLCGNEGLERYFSPDSIPSVHYGKRPLWTYNDVKRYKNMRINGGPLLKVDPSKHGDIGAWNSNTELDKHPETRTQKHEKLLRSIGRE